MTHIDIAAQKNHIYRLEDFMSIKDEWIELHANSEAQSPLLSFEHVNLWYQCFAIPDEVRIYRATEGDHTIGFLPLVLSRKAQVRILSSLTNQHCFHSEPLVRLGYEAIFPKRILESLFLDKSLWDVFQHRFSYSFSPLPGLFSDELLSHRNADWLRNIQPTYLVTLEKPFHKYISSDLRPKVHKTIRQYKNRLAKAGNSCFEHHQGDEAVAQWNNLVTIEDSGWKGEAATSLKRIGDSSQRYYQGFVQLLAKKQALHIFFLKLDNKAIAGAFGYVEGDTFHFAKGGYDEQFRRLSPSVLLFMFMVEHIMANLPEIKRIHLFPWDYGFKHRFANAETFCMETIIYGETMRGKMVQLYSNVKRKLKPLCRRRALTVSFASTK